MAIYYAYGDALVTEEELREKEVVGDIEKFSKEIQLGRYESLIDFSTGKLTAKNLISLVDLPSGETVPFEPIGLGVPLTIQIRHIYTGKYPEKSVFDSTKDMLVTSAMKSIAIFNAAPRAVNFLQQNVKKYSNISNPAATEQGTPLVHYTPALTEKNTILTLEIGFDEFPDDVFNVFGEAFNQAASIPLFVSASTYLLAAGSITKLLGEIGSCLFDSQPKFKATEPLSFEYPGNIIPKADFRIITEQNFPLDVLKAYKCSTTGLVDSNGQLYNGEYPYIIISLDGRVNDEYKDFRPTAASAVQLERFYKIREGGDQRLGPILEGLKLYNDFEFRIRAEKISKEMEALDKTSKVYADKKKEYDAQIANILNDILKPKS